MLIEGKILDVKDHFLCKGFVHIPPQKNLQKKLPKMVPIPLDELDWSRDVEFVDCILSLDITCFTVSSAK